MTEKERQAKEDELFDKAARFVIKQQEISFRLLTKEFKIGGLKAYALMQKLVYYEIVSDVKSGSPNRKILMTIDQYEELPRNNK